MKDRAFYHYGIEGFEVRKENAAVVDIHYGSGKTPLNIFKKDIKRFVRAIISLEEMEERGIERLLNGDEIEIEELNYLLKGRAMILATDFKNYLEYSNGGQNRVCEIAGLRIDGNIDWVEAFPYKELEPSFEDLYPIK